MNEFVPTLWARGQALDSYNLGSSPASCSVAGQRSGSLLYLLGFLSHHLKKELKQETWAQNQ